MNYFELTSEISEQMRDVFLNSKISLSISDARLSDNPLVGVNSAFCSLSGYDPDEILGRNCRFLQPQGQRLPVCDRIRAFLNDDAQKSDNFVIPNVRKDGTSFLNLLYISKLQKHGVTTHLLGSQFDFTHHGSTGIDLYEEALATDLKEFSALALENERRLLQSSKTLASSHSLVAETKPDRD